MIGFRLFLYLLLIAFTATQSIAISELNTNQTELLEANYKSDRVANQIINKKSFAPCFTYVKDFKDNQKLELDKKFYELRACDSSRAQIKKCEWAKDGICPTWIFKSTKWDSVYLNKGPGKGIGFGYSSYDDTGNRIFDIYNNSTSLVEDERCEEQRENSIEFSGENHNAFRNSYFNEDQGYKLIFDLKKISISKRYCKKQEAKALFKPQIIIDYYDNKTNERLGQNSVTIDHFTTQSYDRPSSIYPEILSTNNCEDFSFPGKAICEIHLDRSIYTVNSELENGWQHYEIDFGKLYKSYANKTIKDGDVTKKLMMNRASIAKEYSLPISRVDVRIKAVSFLYSTVSGNIRTKLKNISLSKK
jgi:hypothetical protein